MYMTVLFCVKLSKLLHNLILPPPCSVAIACNNYMYYVCRDAYQGALSEEEMAALEQAAREKSAALALIEAREKEIRAIRDGQLTSKKVNKLVSVCTVYMYM